MTILPESQPMFEAASVWERPANQELAMMQPHDDQHPASRPEPLSTGAVGRGVKWVRRKPVVVCLMALVVVGSLVLAQQLIKKVKTEQTQQLKNVKTEEQVE